MKKIKMALVAIIAMVVFTGCGVKNENSAIIKIDESVITQKDFDTAFDSVSGGMLKSMNLDVKKDSDNLMVLMAKEQVLSQLVVTTIINNEIEKNKITVSKEELNEAEKDILSKFASKDQFLQILKSNGATYDDFIKNLEQEIKVKKYVDSLAVITVGEKEAKKYYNENSDKFKYPQQVRASHILIEANPEAIKAKLKEQNKKITDEQVQEETDKQLEAAKQKAQELQVQLKKNPSSFAKLAKENSQDRNSAVKGGDLGFFTKDEMVEEFSKTAFSLKPNTISEVIQTPYGYHIIMVTDRKEAGKFTFEQTKKDIIAMLENRDKISVFKNKIDELTKNSKIEYLDEKYNPEILQKKIKEMAKDDPAFQNITEENKTK